MNKAVWGRILQVMTTHLRSIFHASCATGAAITGTRPFTSLSALPSPLSPPPALTREYSKTVAMAEVSKVVAGMDGSQLLSIKAHDSSTKETREDRIYDSLPPRLVRMELEDGRVRWSKDDIFDDFIFYLRCHHELMVRAL